MLEEPSAKEALEILKSLSYSNLIVLSASNCFESEEAINPNIKIGKAFVHANFWESLLS